MIDLPSQTRPRTKTSSSENQLTGFLLTNLLCVVLLLGAQSTFHIGSGIWETPQGVYFKDILYTRTCELTSPEPRRSGLE
jgi:hypothetical protein